MKVQVTEHDGVFTIDLTAETMQEAATLTRMGMNTVKDIQFKEANVFQDGEFKHYMSFKKHKRASSTVPKRR